MPTITVYLDRDLDDAVKRLGIPVSKTCQQALRSKIRAIERRQEQRTGK